MRLKSQNRLPKNKWPTFGKSWVRTLPLRSELLKTCCSISSASSLSLMLPRKQIRCCATCRMATLAECFDVKLAELRRSVTWPDPRVGSTCRGRWALHGQVAVRVFRGCDRWGGGFSRQDRLALSNE